MKLPKVLLTASDRIGEALNYTLYYRGGKLDIRLLDVIIAVGCIAFTTYAFLTKGWVAAGQVTLMTVFVLMCVLWFFPSNKVMKK